MNLPTASILNISKFILYQKLTIKRARDVHMTLSRVILGVLYINQNHPIFSDL